MTSVLSTTTTQPAFLTPPQYGERWGFSRSKVYELLDEGLPSIKVGRLRRIDPVEADAWMLEHFGGDQ